MVNKPYHHNNDHHNYDGAPPPMDESWWQAVLVDDEAHESTTARKVVQNNQGGRGSGHRQAPEMPDLDWEKAIRCYEEDQVIFLKVTGSNRGGLLVNGDGLQGFVPVSHLVEPQVKDEEIDGWLAGFHDETLQLKIIECDPERGRVVFSERAALAQPGTRNHLLDSLKPGDCVMGTVTNITDFGIFVDLGGVEGLVHVSEISWGRVHHPSNVVELGQQIQVFIIQVDRERARVALSLKRLCSNPWESAPYRYQPGQIADAVITSVMPYGAFARLEEGLDGLIHISEMGYEPEHILPAELLTEGQQVKVRILHVDGLRQRLGLSLILDRELSPE